MDTRDEAMVKLAEGQYGVLDMAELAAVGVDRRAAWRRAQTGRLFRLHLGVYSIVPPGLLQAEGRWLAAVRAAGEGAALSHVNGAALLELRGIPGGPIHVTVPSASGRRRRRGLVIHRSLSLRSSDVTHHRGIPVTTPARTLRDLKRVVSPAAFESILRRAEQRQLDTGVFGVVGDIDATQLERRLLALCRRHGLPRPRTQVVIGPYTVDCFWPRANLIVEADGFATHGTRAEFEADRARDAWLTVRGYRVVRVTWRQLHSGAAEVVATLRALLNP